MDCWRTMTDVIAWASCLPVVWHQVHLFSRGEHGAFVFLMILLARCRRSCRPTCTLIFPVVFLVHRTPQAQS
jgi:hypothetical protein